MNIRKYILEVGELGFEYGMGSRMGRMHTLDPRNPDYDPKTDPNFGALRNPKVIKALRTASNVVNAINAIVSIGSTIKNVINISKSWSSDIKSHLARSRRQKQFNNITVKTNALAGAIAMGNKSARKKIVQDIRTDALNSFGALRRLFAVETAVALNDLELIHEIEPAIREFLPQHYHGKDIQNIIHNRNNMRELKGIRDQTLETIAHYPKRYKIALNR